MTPSRPIGVLGGTFDPVHVGHVEAAVTVRRWLGLARVLMVLSARPPHKDPAALTDVACRREMLELALGGIDGVEPSWIEVDRAGTGFTIDTLRQIRRAAPPTEPVFIIGRDSLTELPTWRDWRELVDRFDLAVVDRPGATGDDDGLEPEIRRRLLAIPAPGAAVEPAPGHGGRILVVPVAPAAVSSSAIRRRVRDGRSIHGLVHPAVGRYIRNAGLYRREDST